MELPCPVRPSPLLVDKPRTVFNLIDVPQGFSSDACLAWGSAVMQWMRDRDLLVEDTLAFVQRLAANKPAWIETPTRVEQPIAVASEQTAKPRDRIFEREEILQRVADFRANQHKFQREREEHYKSTMAKVHLAHV